MHSVMRLAAAAGGGMICGALLAATPARTPTLAEILAASQPAEWRQPDPAQTLYVELPAGRVIIELAPAFAPLHVENIRTLARERYFDGLAIVRAQDNFVVQWGDPTEKKPLGSARTELAPEFTTPLNNALKFTALPDRDGYAPQVGFVDGFPVARDPGSRTQWLTHCYGAVGVARGNDPRSGNGSALYVVIGQAPRQLDRNIAVAGRVLRGMELLSTLPRGAEGLGFYGDERQYLPIRSVRLASEVPEAERSRLEVLRTESASFATLLNARRTRQDDWMRVPPRHVEICNVGVPVRESPLR